eukprot:7410659-Prorocentrum_lima.AAC.1
MTSSLVGSEMCIRDSAIPSPKPPVPRQYLTSPSPAPHQYFAKATSTSPCLLYTSDAADDM